jgi:hypothetical protein
MDMPLDLLGIIYQRRTWFVQMHNIAKVVQHNRNCTMIVGWNLYRMQKF